MSKIAILFFTLMLSARVLAAEGQPPPETPYPNGTPPSSTSKDQPGVVSKDRFGAASKESNAKKASKENSTMDSIEEDAE